jgi:hypothetical protein
MMRETGAILVSGSTALQLFARRSFYEDSDLDVYVERTDYDNAMHLMMLAGFRKITQHQEKPTLGNRR